MPIDLTDDKKVDVLLQLQAENRKQAEWVKELDFKVVYYTLGLFVGAIVWLQSITLATTQRPIVATALGLVAVLALVFLARNHARHISLNHDQSRIGAALKLSAKGVYAQDALFRASFKPDVAFHAGRGVYATFVIASGLVAIWFLYS